MRSLPVVRGQVWKGGDVELLRVTIELAFYYHICS
jgi:hypothetical protein